MQAASPAQWYNTILPSKAGPQAVATAGVGRLPAGAMRRGGRRWGSRGGRRRRGERRRRVDRVRAAAKVPGLPNGDGGPRRRNTVVFRGLVSAVNQLLLPHPLVVCRRVLPDTVPGSA